MEFEIAKCRQRLDDAFFQELRAEVGSLKFGVSQTEDAKDRVAELEALEKVLKEGIGKSSRGSCSCLFPLRYVNPEVNLVASNCLLGT